MPKPLFVTHQSGFTLFEILLVMAIIALAASIVIPNLNSGKATFLQAQLREAIAVLNYARRSAIVEGTSKVVTFYEGTEEGQDEKTYKPSSWVSRGAKLQWGGEITAKDKNMYEIVFYPEGGSSGGEIVLSYAEIKANIKINALTGKIESDFLQTKK
ncbi:prepilin-type N-terminal cleavage/methylation domain-containing protein [Beggiatoa leptomitoformis]|uniref:Type II secretion system protein GspH n=1 Tax=Beggiatoa leptomitoformis TaxID=288004 RepID=A0A2N9YHT6_9GAMM|nr:prepilin-type N-terminal cleavage/methylation domain-containing protein [Beggiatoa leptomitoformis]ALG67718.1 type II secretion system protein GspH [Beggiatoa leptomitoformis]AUI70044.1 type II secretion system protein GspH [Beggiatoa leptomitoformis]